MRDPFNNQNRPLQEAEFAATTVTYRHVINPRFTYGGVLRRSPPLRFFRRQQFIKFQEGPAFSVFAERVIRPGLKARLEINRLLGGKVERDLIRFAGIRGFSPISEIETRNRINRRTIALQLEGTF